ncbi:hypothetical protein WJX84_005537 [Apatococcus fuscideae]|uniref:Uncharacterized protein n=1 Tax=Apatococcus fuscideae TaxID=2026836 RepID=A0AAW1SNQ4_9CHLO
MDERTMGALSAPLRPPLHRRRRQREIAPTEAPGMFTRVDKDPGTFEVSVAGPEGKMKLRNPCAGSKTGTFFSLEEGRPLGFLGEFIVSSFLEFGELLTKSAVEKLNRWLLGGEADELRAMEPALQQGILDWTRAMPSLQEGSNLLLSKFDEMPWHSWTTSATNDLLSQFSEPPARLPPMIVTRITQAAEILGAHYPAMAGRIHMPAGPCEPRKNQGTRPSQGRKTKTPPAAGSVQQGMGVEASPLHAAAHTSVPPHAVQWGPSSSFAAGWLG